MGLRKIADAKTRPSAQALGGEVVPKLYARLVAMAQGKGHGGKMRVDTTVERREAEAPSVSPEGKRKYDRNRERERHKGIGRGGEAEDIGPRFAAA
jgi:hypothetical protein